MNKISRFAHSFYEAGISSDNTIENIGMIEYIQTTLLPFPDPQREPTMKLAEIIGQQGVDEIVSNNSISFHAVGDTGHENGLQQELVAAAMAQDYDISQPGKSPAFFLHLGDVIYFDNTDKGYQAQFYIPYKKYPGKIIAIPGNHDGEIFKYDGTPTGQKTSLAAFWRNFCQPVPGVPPDAGTILREMISQPGAYWYLDSPFIDIVGLYSNIAEGPGFINVPTLGGKKQTDWLTKTLLLIQEKRKQGNRKALIIVVHHPPFSNGGHSSSVDMLADIDSCCTQAGLLPDAVIAAHAHNYQRFTRYTSVNSQNIQTPYFVVGTGGRGIVKVPPAKGERIGDHSFESSLMGYGYLTVKATPQNLTLYFTQVDANGIKSAFDKQIVVDLVSPKSL